MLRWRGSTSVTSSSSMKMRPASGVTRPPISLSMVDLPAPEGPRIAVSAPEGIRAVTSSTPNVTPKRLVTCLSDIDTKPPLPRAQDRQDDEHGYGDRREDHRTVERSGVIQVLIPCREDVDRQRLGDSRAVARHDEHRTELAECPSERQCNAVEERPADGGERDGEEPAPHTGAERLGCLLLCL